MIYQSVHECTPVFFWEVSKGSNDFEGLKPRGFSCKSLKASELIMQDMVIANILSTSMRCSMFVQPIRFHLVPIIPTIYVSTSSGGITHLGGK